MQFYHENFKRDRPDLLPLIDRTRRNAKEVVRVQGTSDVMELEEEIKTLKRKRVAMEADVEKLLASHDTLQSRLDDAENETVRLRNDLEATKQSTAAMQGTLEVLLSYLGTMHPDLPVQREAVGSAVDSRPQKRRKLNSMSVPEVATDSAVMMKLASPKANDAVAVLFNGAMDLELNDDFWSSIQVV